MQMWSSSRDSCALVYRCNMSTESVESDSYYYTIDQFITLKLQINSYLNGYYSGQRNIHHMNNTCTQYSHYLRHSFLPSRSIQLVQPLNNTNACDIHKGHLHSVTRASIQILHHIQAFIAVTVGIELNHIA